MIKIAVEKAHGDYDPGTSKFFGSPTMPEEWLSDGTVGDDDFFFCQLKLSEFSDLDKDGLLPDNGFIYIFLSEKGGQYIPNVRYSADEPEALIDDFNAGFEFIENPEDEYSIDFFNGDSEIDGTSLLIDEKSSVTLLRYDPLDDNMPSFLADTEKIAYFKIEKTKLERLDFSDIKFEIK